MGELAVTARLLLGWRGAGCGAGLGLRARRCAHEGIEGAGWWHKDLLRRGFVSSSASSSTAAASAASSSTSGPTTACSSSSATTSSAVRGATTASAERVRNCMGILGKREGNANKPQKSKRRTNLCELLFCGLPGGELDSGWDLLSAAGLSSFPDLSSFPEAGSTAVGALAVRISRGSDFRKSYLHLLKALCR